MHFDATLGGMVKGDMRKPLDVKFAGQLAIDAVQQIAIEGGRDALRVILVKNAGEKNSEREIKTSASVLYYCQ
jgi:hypothetical protein